MRSERGQWAMPMTCSDSGRSRGIITTGRRRYLCIGWGIGITTARWGTWSPAVDAVGDALDHLLGVLHGLQGDAFAVWLVARDERRFGVFGGGGAKLWGERQRHEGLLNGLFGV